MKTICVTLLFFIAQYKTDAQSFTSRCTIFVVHKIKTIEDVVGTGLLLHNDQFPVQFALPNGKTFWLAGRALSKYRLSYAMLLFDSAVSFSLCTYKFNPTLSYNIRKIPHWSQTASTCIDLSYKNPGTNIFFRTVRSQNKNGVYLNLESMNPNRKKDLKYLNKIKNKRPVGIYDFTTDFLIINHKWEND